MCCQIWPSTTTDRYWAWELSCNINVLCALSSRLRVVTYILSYIVHIARERFMKNNIDSFMHWRVAHSGVCAIGCVQQFWFTNAPGVYNIILSLYYYHCKFIVVFYAHAFVHNKIKSNMGLYLWTHSMSLLNIKVRLLKCIGST